MTKEEFITLQENHRQSGKNLNDFLKTIGICYSTYNYWRKKYNSNDTPKPLAPISFTPSHRPSSVNSFGDVPSGATLLFPNGLKAHFGSGTESILVELLEKSL